MTAATCEKHHPRPLASDGSCRWCQHEARTGTTVHCLKTLSEPFNAQGDGRKNYEIRSTKDRTFQVGDFLVLHEWDPKTESYSGWSLARWVTYISAGGTWGLPPDVCVLGTSGDTWDLPGGDE